MDVVRLPSHFREVHVHVLFHPKVSDSGPHGEFTIVLDFVQNLIDFLAQDLDGWRQTPQRFTQRRALPFPRLRLGVNRVGPGLDSLGGGGKGFALPVDGLQRIRRSALLGVDFMETVGGLDTETD